MKTKSCPNQGKKSDWNDRWATSDKKCPRCGVSLVDEVHPANGEVPDYGEPLPIPTSAKLARYEKMASECGRIFLGAFYPDGRLIAAKEINGTYHKNGKWSYTELSVVVPAEAVLLCVTRSTHRNNNLRRYLKLGGKEAFIGKLDELDRLPDTAKISEQLGIAISSEQLEVIALYNASFTAREKWAELKQLADTPTF